MDFTSLQPLLWLLLLPVAAAGFYWSLVDRPGGLKVASFLLRVLGVVLLVLALCQPFIERSQDQAHVVFLLDVSQSVDLPAAREAVGKIEASQKALRANDTSTVFTVADGLRERSVADLRQMIDAWTQGVADDAYRSRSRLGEGMLAARLSFPSGKARRLVLYSDGVDTEADVGAALKQLRQEGVDVQFVPVDPLRKSEASLLSLQSVSPLAFEGEVLRLTARALANTPMQAKVRLLNKGVAVQEKDLSLKPDEEAVVWFDTEMTTPGSSVWSAELVPAQDHFPINNQATTTITVRGKPRLLILHEDERQMRPLVRALRQQGFDIDLRGKRGLPDRMEDLLAFDGILLANLSATEMTPRQMSLLRSYVADFGGGLIMLGSENSFGLGGYYKTPVEEVLPIVSRYEKEKEKPSLAMVLVIDKSGSMQGGAIALARQAAKSAAELLSPKDAIAVVAFDGEAQIMCEMTPASQQGVIQSAIDAIEANGGTFMFPAMEAGKEMLERANAKVKHMICLTDGQTSEADHLGLTQQMADQGITVSTVGLGEGAARDLLQQIAEAGRGRYYESNDPESLPQIFTRETTQASKSATQEGLFAPIEVISHPMLAGFPAESLPVALGYVMGEAKPTAQVLLAAETGDPLLAVGRFGLGIGVAYTSDLSEGWGGEWLAWDGCGRFWAQVLRGALRKADTEGLEASSEVRDGQWVVSLQRRAPDQAPVSGIQWHAQVLDEYGNTEQAQVREIGLGRYEASIPIGQRKHLSLRLHDQDHDKLEVRHYHAPYPQEYRLQSSAQAALTALPGSQPDQITAGLPLVTQPQPIVSWFSWAALGCLLLGVLLRRI